MLQPSHATPVPASPDDLYALFGQLDVPFRVHAHPPLHTVEESRHLRGQIPGAHCKSLFLKDRKERLFLVVCLEHRRLNMKWLQGVLGCARLSFGRPEQLHRVLGVLPGAVTPFALINDREARRVRVGLDAEMMRSELLNYHPLHNEATITLAREDFERFLAHCGHRTVMVDFDDTAGKGET